MSRAARRRRKRFKRTANRKARKLKRENDPRTLRLAEDRWHYDY